MAILNAALSTHRMNVFRWGIDAKFPNISTFKLILSTLFLSVFGLNNFEAFLIHVERSFDIECSASMIIPAIDDGQVTFLRQVDRFSDISLTPRHHRSD
jgi:hypothetical protein